MKETKMLTPPQLARRWGTAADKVLALIHSGQIEAINLAVNAGGKPRYRIYLDEIRRFELSRTSTGPAPPKGRRRRSVATVGKEYF